MPSTRTLTAMVALLSLVSCADRRAPAPSRPAGHLFRDEASGIALDLPASWAERYRLIDAMPAARAGVQRELVLRFVRADSSVLTTPPLLVIRVFSSPAWLALPADSSARLGIVVARDSARLVVISTATTNPLPAGSADALAFDSLMFIVLQRQLRASLRPEGVSGQRGPGVPGRVSP